MTKPKTRFETSLDSALHFYGEHDYLAVRVILEKALEDFVEPRIHECLGCRADTNMDDLDGEQLCEDCVAKRDGVGDHV